MAEWNDSFRLGVDQFDEHHRHLFSLFNKTYDIFVLERPRHHLAPVLDELLDYATYHFAAEEAWMQQHNYPQRREHAEEHERFCERISELNRGFSKGKTPVTLEVLKFLQGWLVEHILKRDREYGLFLAARETA
ncbi:hemerythrin [Geobacter sp. SVR]|nr:hemerythrin [Geobacter sp. SVR]